MTLVKRFQTETESTEPIFGKGMKIAIILTIIIALAVFSTAFI